MKRSRSLTLTLAALLGLLVPRAVGVEQRENETTVRTLDIVLGDDGLFVGQVVSTQGHGEGNVAVSLRQEHNEITHATTGGNGRFVVRGLRAGTYQVTTGSSQHALRAWTKSAAPPHAARDALLVDGSTVRGQTLNDTYSNLLSVGEEPSSGDAPNPGETPSVDVLLEEARSLDEAVSNEDLPTLQSPSVEDDQPVEHLPYSHDQTSYVYPEHFEDTTYGSEAPARRGFLSRPWVWGTGVAAAIAIPIAFDDDDAS